MKFVSPFLFLLIFVSIISSCATHSGVMTGNAALSDANFKVVDYAIGTAQTTHVLGIGGLGTEALVLEAKRNLYENYPLSSGQALANVSVDFKRSMFFLVFTLKAVVSADVIDFNEGAVVKTDVEKFPIGLENKRNNDLNINSEMVYFEYQGKFQLGKIVGYGVTNIKVMALSDVDRLRIKRVPLRKLFFLNKNEAILETNFNVGDEVTYTDEIVDDGGAYKNVLRSGTVFGFGQKAAVIKYNVEGVPKFFIVDYDKISLKE